MTENMLDILYAEPADKDFILGLLTRARAEHELPGEQVFWDYILGTLTEWVSYTESWLHLAIFHNIFYIEKQMRWRFKETLPPDKLSFYTDHWEPYLIEQTRRLKEAVHENANLALQRYSDSLREAWQKQRVEHSTEPMPDEPIHPIALTNIELTE